MNRSEANSGSQVSAEPGHVVEPAAEPRAGVITRDTRGELYHHAAGRSHPVRSFTVCDSLAPLEEHRGRGLKPERVLSLLARGEFWERSALPPLGAQQFGRQDVAVFEGDTLRGVVLNFGRCADWFEGKPLALLVTSTSSGTALERVEPAERPDLEEDD